MNTCRHTCTCTYMCTIVPIIVQRVDKHHKEKYNYIIIQLSLAYQLKPH